MIKVLYGIWILIPVGFAVLALYSKLEQISHKDKPLTREPLDLIKQAAFTGLCVIIAFGVEFYFIEDSIMPLLPSIIPKGLIQVMLLPVILYIAAMIIGGAKPIRIQKVSTHDQRREQANQPAKQKKKRKKS